MVCCLCVEEFGISIACLKQLNSGSLTPIVMSVLRVSFTYPEFGKCFTQIYHGCEESQVRLAFLSQPWNISKLMLNPPVKDIRTVIKTSSSRKGGPIMIPGIPLSFDTICTLSSLKHQVSNQNDFSLLALEIEDGSRITWISR